MTNVFISIDMEGIAGIAHLNQVWRGSDDFPAARLLMTKEANAAVAGAFDGGATEVVVKRGFGRGVARSLHPSEARKAIREAAAEVVEGAPEFHSYLPEGPYVLEADTANTSSADLCGLIPGCERTGPRTIRFETPDYRQAFRCLLAWTYLGASEAPRYAGT